MKKIGLFLFIGMMVFGLAGCESSSTFDIGNVSDIEISNHEDVSLSIKECTLENTGVTLVLKNDRNQTLRYDEVYEIEIKKDNEWHKINVQLYFNEPLWGVEQNSQEEMKLNWEYEYGKLPKGDYRIIKEVYFEKEEDQKFYVSAEFTIK